LVEYKTDIGRYGKATSEYTFQDLVAARRLINSVPVWFYENPTHAKQLYGLIKRALGGAWKVGKRIAPYALNAASAANPELAPLLQALKLVL
jgi:alpha-D-ribose 1-methylphosphonate 5-phosphate C-P lyase